jgi:hypothetical protein
MRYRRLSCLALAAVVLGLSACASPTASGSPAATASDSQAPSAAVLHQLMRKSGASATSVHVKGDYADTGQKLRLDVAGRSMRLLVDFGAGPIEILQVSGSFYLKADAAFWTRLEGSAATARLAAGKYVNVPAGSAAGMGDFTVRALLTRVFAEDVFTADTLNGTVQKSRLDGVPAYLMTTRIDGDGKIYVSADGRARLMRTESAKNGTLDFTDWDSVPPASPPQAGQLVTVPGLSSR